MSETLDPVAMTRDQRQLAERLFPKHTDPSSISPEELQRVTTPRGASGGSDTRSRRSVSHELSRMNTRRLHPEPFLVFE